MTQPDTQGNVYGAARNYGASGGTFHDGITMEDAPTQDTANGTPMDAGKFLDALHNVGVLDDHLNQRAGDYRTNKPTASYPVAVCRPFAGVSGVLLSAAGLLAGWNLVETAGATAKIRIRSGIDINQPVLLTVTLAANESTRDFPPLPIEYKGGLYLELVTGAIEGSIYTRETRHV